MLLSKPASCFVDALEIALGVPADNLAEGYRKLVGKPSHDPDVEGYHPAIVNMVLVEQFGRGLSQLEFVPVTEDGEPISDRLSEALASWFHRPGFRCVVTGLRADGNAHALAFRGGRFIDPATGNDLEEPNIGLQYVWCLSVPPVEVTP